MRRAATAEGSGAGRLPAAVAATPPAAARHQSDPDRNHLRTSMDEGQRTPLTTAAAPGDEAFAPTHRRLQDLRALLGRVIVGQDELITIW